MIAVRERIGKSVDQEMRFCKVANGELFRLRIGIEAVSRGRRQYEDTRNAWIYAGSFWWPREDSNLRHMLSDGVAVKVVAERLGHSNVGITLSIYAHVLPSMQKDAAAVMDRLLG